MMLGKLYGKGLTDLDAAYKALEQLKPIKLVDFTGQMEKMLLSGRGGRWASSTIAASTATTAQNQPIAFAAPAEGVLSLEQVLNVTPGSKVKELAYGYIDYMLRPDIQKRLAEAVWYSPSNKNVKLDAEIRRQALQHRGKGRDADPGRLEMVQRAQGRHRCAGGADSERVIRRPVIPGRRPAQAALRLRLRSPGRTASPGCAAAALPSPAPLG